MSTHDKPHSSLTQELLRSLPAILQEKDGERIKSCLEQLDLTTLPAQIRKNLIKVLACSNFVCQWGQKNPVIFNELVNNHSLQKSFSPQMLKKKLETQAATAPDIESLGKILRQTRHEQLVHLAWLDICGRATLQATIMALSDLADNCIKIAYTKLFDKLATEFGKPVNDAGEPQSMVVIAMGKLGGQELNFSSDVDLIFAYSDDGETQGGSRSLTNHEFFTRLGQQLINLLDQKTADGFVFRVDMRLRPFGQSGALALSFDALENYYQTHGREWERYAMIKARLLTGEKDHQKLLANILKPFVYRRYLDFNVYESLRSMKQMIIQEIRRKDINNNVKLGAGGIREIEFISQTFQLIRGGRHPIFQNPHLLPTLKQLEKTGVLPDYTCVELRNAYVFLRNTEHRLQQFDDQQTHDLPTDKVSQSRLAFSMEYESWTTFSQKLEYHRKNVSEHFDSVFVAPQKATDVDSDNDFFSVWANTDPDDHARTILSDAGYQHPDATLKALAALQKSSRYRTMGSHTQLSQLMPLLLSAISKQSQPDETLLRIIKFIEQILQRSTYIALLLEFPMALSQLVKLCAASSLIADALTKHPILLDELLDPRTLYSPPDKNLLEQELTQQLDILDDDDLENQMETLRLFKQVNVLRVAAADIVDALPLTKVSTHLTWIAEVILKQVLLIAWNDLASKHGVPLCSIKDQVTEPGFAIVAYGKLGGKELGYGSDLDLVFLHCAADDSAMTTGSKSIAVPVFFARLGQRIIHLVNTLTQSGVLYEVDMRLRPSGSSGLLVSHINTFSDYQSNKAWTWEHQALVRARAVVGDENVAKAFTEIRHNILTQTRNNDSLQNDVREMREKMRKSNDKSDKTSETGKFDLKQGRGGIADIEFIVQYSVLSMAHKHPELLEFNDNINLLQCLEEYSCLEHDDATNLTNAYQHYRSLVHEQALADENALVDNARIEKFREQIILIWDKLLGSEQ